MVLLTVRTHGPYYTNSGYLPCARAHGPQWLLPRAVFVLKTEKNLPFYCRLYIYLPILHKTSQAYWIKTMSDIMLDGLITFYVNVTHF